MTQCRPPCLILLLVAGSMCVVMPLSVSLLSFHACCWLSMELCHGQKQCCVPRSAVRCACWTVWLLQAGLGDVLCLRLMCCPAAWVHHVNLLVVLVGAMVCGSVGAAHGVCTAHGLSRST
jgi:hypothetical protein